MKTLSEVKPWLLKDRATREAYIALVDEFSVAHELIAARLGTTQSVVAHPVALCASHWVQRNGEADTNGDISFSRSNRDTPDRRAQHISTLARDHGISRDVVEFAP